MKKFLGIFSSVVMLAALLTSCNTNNDVDTITEQAFSSCFAYVRDITTGVDAVYSQVGYQLRLNYTKLTADVLISNLKTPDGTSYPTFTVKDIPWTIEKDGAIVVSGRDLTPSGTTGAAVPLFSSFKLRLMERVVDNSYLPGFCISYTINRQYSVLSSNAVQVIFGTTKSTDEAGTEFTTDKTNYYFEFNADTRRVTITLQNAMFLSNMPAMNIALENIPFTFDGTTAKWHIDAITPKSGGTPYESFPITDLSGEFEFGKDMEMEFYCDPAKAPGKYKIEVDCSFNFYRENG